MVVYSMSLPLTLSHTHTRTHTLTNVHIGSACAGKKSGNTEMLIPHPVQDTCTHQGTALKCCTVQRAHTLLPCTLAATHARSARVSTQIGFAWCQSQRKSHCAQSYHCGARMRAALLMGTDEGSTKVLRQLHAGKTPWDGEARGLTPRTTGRHVARTTQQTRNDELTNGAGRRIASRERLGC